MAQKPVTQKVKVTGVYDALSQAVKPIVVCYGGSGSSKSHSMAQWMIWKKINEHNKVIGIGRKTFPALRMTSYLLMVNLLKAYGIYPHVEHNKTENIITYGSNRVQFFSLDDPEKIKSAIFNYLWLEETNEFTWEDFTILKLRLSRDPQGGINQMYLTFNPVDSWIFDKLEHDPDAQWIHSTYRDNPFVSEAYAALLEGLKEQDQNYYNIYALGKRGRLENIIYPAFTLIDEMPTEFEWERYGLDFGFENPTACVHIGVMGNRLYLDEMLYQTHMTNSELIDLLKNLPRRDIYADSAEPQRIEEICRAGLRCYPATKDIQFGIDTVKRYVIMITKRSVNGIKEIRSYQRKKDKDGKVLEEPVKFNDHFCFIAGTMIKTSKGDKPIETVKVGDKVLTRRGYYPVVACGMTNPNTHIIEAHFDNGEILTGTGNHPIFVNDKGFTPLDTLRYGDIIEVWGMNKLFTKACHTAVIQNHQDEQTEITFVPAMTQYMGHDISTEKSGKMLTGKYQKVAQFIIKMAIPSIMNWTILSVNYLLSTGRSIVKNMDMTLITLPLFVPLLSNGIGLVKAVNGIGNMAYRHSKTDSHLIRFATNVGLLSRQWVDGKPIGFAQMFVNRHGVEQAARITNQDFVSSVEINLPQINTVRPKPALSDVRVLSVVKLNEKQSVYNLTVDTVHEYFANGILVSNCDATRYAVVGGKRPARFGFGFA